MGRGISRLLAGWVLIIVLAGWGSVGLAEDLTDIVGAWRVEEIADERNCGESFSTYHLDAIVTREGDGFTVATQRGVFSGWTENEVHHWTGPYPEDGGITTITGTNVTLSAGGLEFSGDGQWIWQSGGYSCSGPSQLWGTRIDVAEADVPLVALPDQQGGDEQEPSVGFRLIQVDSVGVGGEPVSLDVAVWYPSTDPAQADSYAFGNFQMATELARNGAVAPGPHPLILFSHGAGGSGHSTAYICEGLARAGFVVVAPDHTDAVSCVRLVGNETCRLGELLAYAGEVRNNIVAGPESGLAAFGYRPAQARDTLNAMLALNGDPGSPFHGTVDCDRVGMFGHSFGAWTTMLLAGAVEGEAWPGLDGAVSLSGPTTETTFSTEHISSLNCPIMYQAGSREWNLDRYQRLLYDPSPAPKYLIQVEGADHNTFAGGAASRTPSIEGLLSQPHRGTIAAATIDFFLAHVAGDSQALARLEAGQYPGTSQMLADPGP